jgi:hypothetical protein
MNDENALQLAVADGCAGSKIHIHIAIQHALASIKIDVNADEEAMGMGMPYLAFGNCTMWPVSEQQFPPLPDIPHMAGSCLNHTSPQHCPPTTSKPR